MEIAVFTGLGLLLATAAGLGLGRYAWPATRRGDAAALLAQQIEAARLNEECRALRIHVDQLETAYKAASIEAQTAVVEVARLQERENALSDKIAAQAAQRADLQTQLTTEFENIANRILKANASELSETSQRAVAAILEPLRERLHDFQSKIETTYASEGARFCPSRSRSS
jgi:DNA recombination protein RmuC